MAPAAGAVYGRAHESETAEEKGTVIIGTGNGRFGEGRPRVGLALGSGAARGWAHIGVIKALREAGIEPDLVCGTSIGALVGAAHASGQLEPLERWVRGLSWREVIRFMDLQLTGGGIVEGEKLIELVRRHTEDVAIESLPVPFAAVATELATGQEIWFQQGSTLEAVRASCALPGLFPPVRHGHMWLADGGMVNPVPVSLCRAMGAEVVIAVNLNGDIVGKHFRDGPERRLPARRRDEAEEGDLFERLRATIGNSVWSKAEAMVSGFLGRGGEGPPGLFEVLSSALNIMQDRITRSRMAGDPPDIVLAPRLAHIALLEFDRASEAIEEGEQAVRQILPAIEAAVGRA